jgi:outer membrane lipoprotein-sorting protein
VKRLVAVLALLGPALAFAAAPPDADVILKHLDEASKKVTALDGDFVQHNRVKLFKQELTSKGRIKFEAPRHIVWEYTEPDPSTLVLDGNKATLTQPGAAPRVFDLEHDATMRTIFDQLLLWLGPGSLAQAKNDYELTTSGSAAEPVLGLTPRPSSPVAKAFQKIELKLDGKTWLLKAIKLVEKNGDEKEIVFTRMQRR